MNEAPMVALVVKNPIQVTNRLAELGWTVDDVLEIVSAMVRARNSCTSNHPASAPGFSSWSEGTRRMREVGLPRGLVREDADGIPWTTDKKRALRFAVANTDDGTAVEGRIPQNRSKRGAATDRAVDANQISIFDLPPDIAVFPISRIQSHPGTVITWYLCVHCDGDTVSAELSCPIGTEAGFFADFAERIFILGRDPFDGLVARKDDGLVARKDNDDGDSEYEVTVIRK